MIDNQSRYYLEGVLGDELDNWDGLCWGDVADFCCDSLRSMNMGDWGMKNFIYYWCCHVKSCWHVGVRDVL